ncbi:MAG: hypothetical protein KatS3mg108_0962 [Isosphaeraceae bacterium]|jgi:nucleoid DNA-binding protein|nr:MAG: hypothetical protein KatS3mg108_0962 [Isosphaeraceae bacterium]
MAKKAAPKAGDSAKPKAATKSELYSTLAEKTGLTKKEVASVFDAFVDLTRKHLGKKGPGVILIPGMAKIKATIKPATKATTKPNPFKPGEMMTVKAKPATTRFKIVPLKAYKESL